MSLDKLMTVYNVELTLTRTCLGGTPLSRQVAADHTIEEDVPEESTAEELALIEEVDEPAWTGFHTLGDRLLIFDFMIRGHLKSACGALRRCDGKKGKPKSLSADIRAYKKIIDGLVFVEPRHIFLDLPEDARAARELWHDLLTDQEQEGENHRPLRASTPQGDRVALAHSKTVPPGTKMHFQIRVLGDVVSEELLREWLDYGEWNGLRQWRGGGWGTFSYKMTRVEAAA